jgi:hypothetical protein
MARSFPRYVLPATITTNALTADGHEGSQPNISPIRGVGGLTTQVPDGFEESMINVRVA